ncbi:hypothetical protein SRS16CHR_02585 [Variovorax sp. SRS16]|uniref:helix-turn-helix domain-containing protein n=1 Tax=Variovorax sp. SRS16 TaxID=282217 RepID=UPI001318334D|nr:helix-turn-helix domain-containing protein [Variovorax sp. SRS16]VTU20152.1 hypothetical protein SRS16CHR_02585 [Variovorax sp. SRS16]
MKNPQASFQTQGDLGTGSEGLDSTSQDAKSPLLQLTRKEQHDVIVKALCVSPKLTTELRDRGCWMANSRVFELRAMGLDIKTTMVTAVSADGRLRRQALYSLAQPASDWTPIPLLKRKPRKKAEAAVTYTPWTGVDCMRHPEKAAQALNLLRSWESARVIGITQPPVAGSV